MNGEYKDFATAVMAMQACQMYFAMKGYPVSSSIYESQMRCELIVYFDGKPMPQLPAGYSCSNYEIESYTYYSNLLERVQRVRTKDFYFTWIGRVEQ